MASSHPDGDPRLADLGERQVTPRVARPRAALSGVAIAILMAVLALLLFSVLDGRRRSTAVPAVRPGADERVAAAVAQSPPPLYLPPAPPPPAPPPPVVAAPQPAPAPAPRIVYVPQPAPPASISATPVTPPPQRAAGGPALVYDSGAPTAPTGRGTAAGGGLPAATAGGSLIGSRARTGMLANRSTTVPQGSLIPAVLETGFDSTRPGLARALVTRDVRGFDGTTVLIPRGSRLIGEYRSDTQPGQNRALINWTRLIRPDAVTIAIDSPSSDPVGRGGIRASVDNHFFERFAGAILQSSLDIGVNLASRSAGSPVIVALPNAAQSVVQPLNQAQQIRPTLKVKPGTSITVFVARDLDFTGTEIRR